MKKQMKKAVYEAPVTERFSVELEGGFMAGSVDLENKEGNSVTIEDHSVNTGFTAEFGDSYSGESNWE